MSITTNPANPAPSVVQKFLARFSWRDIGHFLFPAVSAFLLTWFQSKLPLSREAIVAAGSGAAGILFRQLFPNINVTAEQLAGFLARLNIAGTKLAQTPVIMQPVPTPVVVAPLANVAPVAPVASDPVEPPAAVVAPVTGTSQPLPVPPLTTS